MLTLKDLVLNSLESFEDFEVDEKPLTRKSYEKLADAEVENYYLEVNKETGHAYMVVKLTEN